MREAYIQLERKSTIKNQPMHTHAHKLKGSEKKKQQENTISHTYTHTNAADKYGM